MTRRAILSLIILVLALTMRAQGSVDFPLESFLSFEKSTAPALPHSGRSKLSLSDFHYKNGNKALRWDWKSDGSSFRLNVPVPYRKENPNPKEKSISSFVFWLYSPEKLQGKLTFSFYKEGKLCTSFDYSLGFEGWRGAWVAFGRDMKGAPEEDMDLVEIKVSGAERGTLYFDGIIPAVFEDSRYHTPDVQAPFINENTDVHWLLLNRYWHRDFNFPQGACPNGAYAEMDSIEAKFVKLVSPNAGNFDFGKLKSRYAAYGIRRKGQGRTSGKPVFFVRYAETYLNLGIEDAKASFAKSGQLLKSYNDLMFDLASAWKSCRDEKRKTELEKMYITMTEHLLDQGFASGSGMGTLHHLGYSMRNFYTAPVIMKDVLKKHGLLEKVQQAMEWFSGVGEVKSRPEVPGVDIDAFNTYLLARMAAILMLENSEYKYNYLQALSLWVDNGFKYTSGTLPAFKSDGTVFHHRRAYPAYATGGMDGAVKAVWLLSGTSLAISPESHGNLKNALMEMRFYCNLRSFPLAMSGRHPDGKGALIPSQYALLADAGSPDGKERIDKELAAAYLRLSEKKSPAAEKFRAAGIEPEKSPVGAKSYYYNSSLSYRKDDWLVTIAGHSRYLWSAEIYVGANHYGRYLTHGSMEILADSSADEISSFGSGYSVDGYDWCHIPGTTAAARPMEDMKAVVLNVDKFSGYEEMLLSDQWFAGAVVHGKAESSDKGKYGAYAMILHENDKYNGSLCAHKSYFAFDNRIICLGSGLCNSLPSSELHTSLFQNRIDENSCTSINGKAFCSSDTCATVSGNSCIRDRFGNAWFVKGGEVLVSRSLQHSLHEETDRPTQGLFEKAYIRHWRVDEKGLVHDYSSDGYEYMSVIHPKEDEIKSYTENQPYKVLSRSDSLHAVLDEESGTVGAAVFEKSAVDSLVEYASPCMMMYSRSDGGRLVLSVSNPDLALYKGEADEVCEGGRRKERSVYSRAWIDNPCGDTEIEIKLKGKWALLSSGRAAVQLSHEKGSTVLKILTKEAVSEELILKYEN